MWQGQQTDLSSPLLPMGRLREQKDGNAGSWLTWLQTHPAGDTATLLVCCGHLRDCICSMSHEFPEADAFSPACRRKSWSSCAGGLGLSEGAVRSWRPCPVCLGGRVRRAPRSGLAGRTVICTIYLFLELGPLANCISLCWISLDFNHALFSLQLNYLYI